MRKYRVFVTGDGVVVDEIYEFDNFDHVYNKNGWFTVFFWFNGSLRKYGFRNKTVLYGEEIE